jgi:hypothetical protein
VARLALNPAAASRAGVDVTAAALTVTTGFTGVQFVNNGSMLLVVNNTSGSTLTLTYNISPLVEPEAALHAAAQMPQATIPTGKTYVFGPWSPKNYKQADGNIYIDFAGAATIAVGLIGVSAIQSA